MWHGFEESWSADPGWFLLSASGIITYPHRHSWILSSAVYIQVNALLMIKDVIPMHVLLLVAILYPGGQVQWKLPGVFWQPCWQRERLWHSSISSRNQVNRIMFFYFFSKVQQKLIWETVWETVVINDNRLTGALTVIAGRISTWTWCLRWAVMCSWCISANVLNA